MRGKEEREKKEEVVTDLPVDEGYAWVIAFAASMILFMVLGSLKCFGVFYVELARKYNVSSKEIQSIQSLTGFFYLGLGPVANALSLRFTNRAVIIVGGLLVGTGFLATAFAPSLGYFYLTYGCLTGFGYGLSFSPCIVSFVHYFHKRRVLANGMVTAGGCLGAVILPMLMRFLIDLMTLEDCMMIFGGILYNICVFACLLRPHENYPIKKKQNKRKTDGISQNSVDQQSLILLDASDLMPYDDKSYISIDELKSQHSYFSEGANKRLRQSGKMTNASIVSLKSFNPSHVSVATNPEMTRSMCSEDQNSLLDIGTKSDKAQTASMISLKSFNPSLYSNSEPIGKSMNSDEHPSEEVVDMQMNASVISLKSFDPSVCSNIETLGKSALSDDQHSIDLSSVGEASRKLSLGVASVDSLLKDSVTSNCNVESSMIESSSDNKDEEDKRQCVETDSTSITNDIRESHKQSQENPKSTVKPHKGKRRQYSAGSTSLKNFIANRIDEEGKNFAEDSKSMNSYKAEKEFLLKNIYLKKQEERNQTASVISLKSYDPSLCASLGAIAGISMQSIPQDFENISHGNKKLSGSHQISRNDIHPSGCNLFCSRNLKLCKNPVFLLYLVFIFCESLGYLSLFNVLPPFTEEIGGSDRQGAMIVSILSISELFGRLFFGWFSYMCHNHLKISYLSATLLMALGIVFTPDMKLYLHLAIFCGIYGFFTGGYNGVIFSMVVNSLGLETFSHAFGYITFSAAVSLLINPVESGLIKDETGSWENVFRINGGVAVFGCVMFAVIMFLERRKSHSTGEMDLEMDVNVDL